MKTVNIEKVIIWLAHQADSSEKTARNMKSKGLHESCTAWNYSANTYRSVIRELIKIQKPKTGCKGDWWLDLYEKDSVAISVINEEINWINETAGRRIRRIRDRSE